MGQGHEMGLEREAGLSLCKALWPRIGQCFILSGGKLLKVFRSDL